MSAPLPLRHTVVLDLTDEAGVQGARLLAELGARVIRVEERSGDALRQRGPFLDGEPGTERGLAHLLYNAGKESVALALDQADAWALVDRLAARVDLLLAPLRQSTPVQQFLDEQRIAATHPHLCVVDVVFRRGPLAGRHRAVTDLIGVAAGGLLYVNGFPEDPPNLPYGKLAYRQVSANMAATATALLLGRRRHGRRGRVSISLQEAVAFTMTQATHQNLWRWRGPIGVRAGLVGFGYPAANGRPDGPEKPDRSTYRTRDGKWVSFAAWPAAWNAYAALVAEVTGDDRLLQPEWSDPLHRFEHRDIVHETTIALCTALPRDELVAVGQRHGQLILPVNDAKDVVEDPHLTAREFYRQEFHPHLGRTLTMPGSVFLSSRAGRPVLTPAPGLGEHTVAVLRELCGLTEEELSALQATGTIATSEGVQQAEAFGRA